MKKSYLLPFILIYLLFSCKNDDGTPSDPLITITDLPVTDGDDFIIVSGVGGEILNRTKIADITEAPLVSRLEYKKENIHVLYIQKDPLDNGKNIFIRAFINLKRGGKWSMKEGKTENNVQAKVRLTNTEEFSALSIVSNKEDRSLTSLGDTVGLSLEYFEGSKLYVDIMKPTGRFYSLLDINNAKNIAVDLASINKEIQYQDFTFPSGNAGFTSISGILKNGDSREMYSLGLTHITPNTTRINIAYPGTTFTEYANTTFIILDEKRTYTMHTTGALPPAFITLDAQAEVTSWSPVDFQASFSGQFDTYQAVYLSTDATLNIYAPSSVTSFKLPEIGVAIEETNLRLKDFTPNSIILNEYDDYTDDPSYFKYYNEQMFPVNNSKQVLSFQKAQ